MTLTYDDGIIQKKQEGAEMKIVNPYRPGAGQMPLFLAGRDQMIKEVSSVFDALCSNIPVQSIIFVGLRGVGKTVLLNRLETIASDEGIFCEHIETDDKLTLITQIISICQKYLRKNSFIEKFKNVRDDAIDAIKSLTISFNPNDNTFGLSVQEKELYRGMDVSQSLTDLLTSVGKIAYESDKPLCFFIDEMQTVPKTDLKVLVQGIHRCNQLGYPLMLIAAGLPRLQVSLMDVASYTERLFSFHTIDSLNKEQAEQAIRNPAAKLGVTYTIDAINEIVDVTGCYPYFVQLMCKILFDECKDTVTSELVKSSISKFHKLLDDGFFRSRYLKCSDTEKKFIFAMVECGGLPAAISDIARNLNKQVTSISPTRAQLINKGIVFSVEYSKLDFTVPKFDEFINRLDEYKAYREMH